ncbi:MAG TPA: hypothetical protein VMM76_22175 [Pirellulaceae bacterium]|nr:hypothetical protein [Pirellulaceae bacterium]
MRKIGDAKKEQYWRDVIRRQGKSGEAITRFCAREGLSPHQFHWWRRTLRTRDGQSASGPQVCLDDKVARQDDGTGQSFVPVRLPFLTQAPIEMVHPDGWVVRIPAGFDPLSLGCILSTLDSRSSASGEN